MAEEKTKGDITTKKRRVEVLIAVFILLLFVGLAAGAYLVFSDKCGESKTSAGSVKDIYGKHVAFKTRPRSSIFKNEKMLSEIEETGEVHDNLRLHEFASGKGKYVQVLDHKESLRSTTQTVMAWFRIDSCDKPITLIAKMGHDEALMDDQPEFRPYQKVYELLSMKKKLILNIYGRDGNLSMSLEADSPNHRDSQWHQIGFAIGKDACIYLDGMQIACRRTAPALVTAITPVELVVAESRECELHVSNLFVSIDEMSKIQVSSTYDDGNPVNPRFVVPKLRIWIPFQFTLMDMMMNSKPEIKSMKKENQQAYQARVAQMKKNKLLRVPFEDPKPTFVF